MANYKHLNIEDRDFIAQSLKENLSFKAIARKLGKDPSTISKEVRNHITFRKSGAYGRSYNACANKIGCNHSRLCNAPDCKHKLCSFCERCNKFCSDFVLKTCLSLSKPPYVCNGCKLLNKCTLEKALYLSSYAQKEYDNILRESRQGISINEKEVERLDNFISPLLKQGQSIHHICTNNSNIIMHHERTIYNYVDATLFSARNIDLPRKVRFRPRKQQKNNYKVDKSCRIGRTYKDFLAFMTEHPDTPVIEIDSVEGIKGGKVLLTIHFTVPLLMLAFLRDSNNSQSVIDIFNHLYSILGKEVFSELFPVILADNGSEFSNPNAIEFDENGNRRTYLFYCEPSSPFQKGAAENNHEFIRRVLPKGTSFDNLSQQDISLMMNHINSYSRKNLNDRPPYQSFNFLYGPQILEKLGTSLIQPNHIILSPKLLRK